MTDTPTLYDDPGRRPVPARVAGKDTTLFVRELGFFEIARLQREMLALAVALYSQPAVADALKRGDEDAVQLQPAALLMQVPAELRTLLAVATDSDADTIERVAYASMFALIAAFVEMNAGFFIDWLRQSLNAQPDAPAPA